MGVTSEGGARALAEAVPGGGQGYPRWPGGASAPELATPDVWVCEQLAVS